MEARSQAGFFRRRWTAVLGLAAVAGCVAPRPAAPPAVPGGASRESEYVKTELYFGRARPDGEVSEEEFQSFVDEYVAPNFRGGLTILDAGGQFEGERGWVREKTKVIVWVHPDTPQANERIEYVRAAYRRLFQQEAVLRVTQRVAVSFREPAELTRARELGVVRDERIRESSGLAYSTLSEGVLWTHNDSGDGPMLYALNLRGETLASYYVSGAEAYDWEDLASVRMGSRSYLVVGDVGDNGRIRPTCRVYFVEEPLVRPEQGYLAGTVTVARTVVFTYEDQPHDCEAIAVDSETATLYLVVKQWRRSPVFALRIPPVETPEVQIAHFAGWFPASRVTAMDFSNDGLRWVVATYGNAYELRRRPGEAWSSALRTRAHVIPLPRRAQGEAICYGPDGLTLYLTSDSWPTPLWEVPLPVATQ